MASDSQFHRHFNSHPCAPRFIFLLIYPLYSTKKFADSPCLYQSNYHFTTIPHMEIPTVHMNRYAKISTCRWGKRTMNPLMKRNNNKKLINIETLFQLFSARYITIVSWLFCVHGVFFLNNFPLIYVCFELFSCDFDTV